MPEDMELGDDRGEVQVTRLNCMRWENSADDWAKFYTPLTSHIIGYNKHTTVTP